MPNAHGQVTREDFKAPAGQFRIIREEMSDGQLSIIADFHQQEFATLGVQMARATHPEDVFTLCDENGIVEEPASADGQLVELLGDDIPEHLRDPNWRPQGYPFKP